MAMRLIHDGPHYRIHLGNGAVLLGRKADGHYYYFQPGDDAGQFLDALDATHDGYTIEDVCAEYDEVLEPHREG